MNSNGCRLKIDKYHIGVTTYKVLKKHNIAIKKCPEQIIYNILSVLQAGLSKKAT